jgi:hypothetical protein
VTAPEHGFCLRGDVGGKARELIITSGDNSVGCDPGNDIVIDLPGVSRRHAMIRFDSGNLQIEDLGSKNGTYVNGARITEAMVREGDLIRFANVTLTVEAVDVEDTELSIPISGLAAAPAERRRYADSTSTKGDAMVPQGWLKLISQVIDALAEPHADVAQTLGIMRSGLEADGVSLVKSGQQGEVIVDHTTGGAWAVESLERVTEVFESTAQPTGETPVITGASLDGQPPLATAAAGCSAGPIALVVHGDYPDRDASLSLLQTLLGLILRKHYQVKPAVQPYRGNAPALVFPDGYVVTQSPPMTALFEQISQVASGEIPILITGETGVGKEPLARTIHLSSPAAGGPFKAVNCAAIPGDLLEAELFGIERGVATGVDRREGILRSAAGGVIFLDEIGEMPTALQAKLLRVLQEKEIRPVGARRTLPFAARVVAATNTDLPALIADGRFRSDLYYRIAGCTLQVPALCERREDIPALIEDCLRRYAAETDKQIRGISVKALRMLVEAP